jgi:hypothetical protein
MDIHEQAAGDDVFPAGGVGIEPDRGGQQCRDPTAGVELAPGRLVDAGEHFQQCALTRAVGADDCEPVAGFDVQGDAAQRLHRDPVVGVAPEVALRRAVEQYFPQRAAAARIDWEFDRDVAQAKRGVHRAQIQ